MAMLTLEDWRAWHGETFPLGSWRTFEGGFEAMAGAPRIDLVSRATYRNFIFRFEFSLPVAGNSGVLYRVDESAALSWHSGPEMQLLDDRAHPDGREPTTRNGALYGLLRPEFETPIEPDRFIEGALILRDGEVEHWLCGQRVLRYRLDDPAVRERIAASKFRHHPGFANAERGHIVLQHHGEAVRFRRLSLEAPD